MHDNLDLILTLTGGMTTALVFGFITTRLGLSPLVGYLLAGLIVGPHTPGFVADESLAAQMAEIGVILLMFGVGLQFHLKELLAVKRVAIPGALAQIAVATALGAWVGHEFGWSVTSGLIFGVAISVASTVVLIRVLSDNNVLHTQSGHVAVGWLVVEDIFTVLALVLLPAIVGGNAGAHGAAAAGAAADAATAASHAVAAGAGSTILMAVLIASAKLAAMIAFTLIVGQRVIPRLLTYVAMSGSRELFTLTVLVIALGISVGAAKLFGASMALGAFLAGMVVGQSDFSNRAASEALPFRDAFAVVFFVSVGMLLNPWELREEMWMVLATLGVILVGKPLVALLVVRMLRFPFSVGIAVAVALAQIGEFSFILAALGRELGVLPAQAVNVLVTAAVISITLNPLLYKLVAPMTRWVIDRPALARLLHAGPSSELAQAGHVEEHVDAAHRAIIVGFGPVGQSLAQILRENGISPTIIELNVKTLELLRQQKWRFVYGDAASRDTLLNAGIKEASALILSASSVQHSEATVRLAHELNPKIRVMARATYVREAPALVAAGADVVFSAEAEVALAMTERLVRELGATPEQIDRERERVRRTMSPEAAA
jgi:CPA2 family monovalent cation:H+ antiporter-2